MARLADLNLVPSMEALKELPEGKMLINTVNAWSWVVAGKDGEFARALKECDALIPDGISIVKACRFLNLPGAPKERIAGADLFAMEMEKLNRRGGRCFFLGSSETVLSKIVAKAAEVYPSVVVETYSPPYKPEFSPEDDAAMIAAVNAADPDPTEFVPFQETVNGFAADARDILQILNSVAAISGGRFGLNGQIIESHFSYLLSS